MDGKAVKEIRKALGITQEDLATILGVTKTTVARYEMENGQNPQGDVEKKLNTLKSLIKHDKTNFLELFAKGGVIALAGIVAISVVSRLGAGPLTLATFGVLPGVRALAEALFNKKQ